MKFLFHESGLKRQIIRQTALLFCAFDVKKMTKGKNAAAAPYLKFLTDLNIF